MAYGTKTCPDCGAVLDAGEVCDCRVGESAGPGFGRDAAAFAAEKKAEREAEEAAKLAAELERCRELRPFIKWVLTAYPNVGPATMEAHLEIGGKWVPVMAYHAYINHRLREWKIYPKTILRADYRCLVRLGGMKIDEMLVEARYR